MMIISVLAITGLIGLILGFWSIFYVNRFVNSEKASPEWKKFHLTALIIGLIIGVLSWPGTFLMGYPISSDTETIRVVGIPFVAAYFDSAGRDYVGLITILSIIGNGIFWFLIPHTVLAIHLKQSKRHNTAQELPGD